MTSLAPQPRVVLVHGGYADGSSWSEVIEFPAPPANAGLVYTGGFGGLTEDAFLNDFANGVDPVRVEIDSGHLSLITHPREVTELILSAAQAASHDAAAGGS